MTTPSPTDRRSTRLYKDPIDKKIAGVASGVAKYFDIDTTLMRAIWAASVFVGGFGLFLYLILWFILDDDPEALAALESSTDVEPVDGAATGEGSAALEDAAEEIDAETFEAEL